MMKAAEILERDKEKFGQLMTLEMGKPYKAAVAEAQKCAAGCRYYAKNAESFLTDEIIETGAKKNFHSLSPHRSHSCRHAVELSLLASGEVCRSGSDGWQRWTCLSMRRTFPQCALAIEKIFLEAGFPGGVPDSAHRFAAG